MKKYGFMALGICIIFICSSTPAYAATLPVNSNDTKMATTITISDPETGDIWEWEIPISESKIKIQAASAFASPCNSEETLKNSTVELNMGKYLMESFGLNPSVSSVLEDDVTLTVGMTYSADAVHDTVTLYNVFGSITNLGLYYVSQRAFYWRNPGASQGRPEHPSSNSWNYPVTPTPGFYSSDLPPYTLLDCRIQVTGMTAYRDLSVKCELML